MTGQATWMRRAAIGLAVLIVLVAAVGVLAWWKLFKSEEQSFADDRARFNYGSLGAELVAGIPYPIFMVLPRVFPDLVEQYATQGYGPQKAGHGGYGAFGLAWEEGERLPIGLSIKRLGYERVTLNCALCHTTSYRIEPGDTPSFAFGGSGHTINLQGLLRFLFAASHDRRFTAARLLPEIALHFPLDWIDGPLYALYLIPKTRLALRVAEQQLGWMATRPGWGPGRDDAFNLPKFVLTQTAWDNTIGSTDFPALWRLADRDGYLLHAGGEAKDVYAVVASSALGVGSLPLGGGFEARNRWIENFLRTLEPPKYPDPLDEALASRGRALFEAQCASCHAKGGTRIGTAIPLDEIGTDPEHVRTWTQRDADRMNEVTALLGMRASPLQGAQGYVARPLVGVWLLGPYLHNGSVPTLWDLLSPAAQRSSVFYRGYDVIDRERVGFVAQGSDAEARGFRFDTTLRGNGNRGHEYGTTLSEADRRALIEYLKGL
jgi:mono/diheme cytochrome c family protein